jgi:hypothetical protein
MTGSHLTRRTFNDARIVLVLTAAHAAVAIPALLLWAAVCERARRRHPG